jgi:hypothetical protein
LELDEAPVGDGVGVVDGDGVGVGVAVTLAVLVTGVEETGAADPPEMENWGV